MGSSSVELAVSGTRYSLQGFSVGGSGFSLVVLYGGASTGVSVVVDGNGRGSAFLVATTFFSAFYFEKQALSSRGSCSFSQALHGPAMTAGHPAYTAL